MLKLRRMSSNFVKKSAVSALRYEVCELRLNLQQPHCNLPNQVGKPRRQNMSGNYRKFEHVLMILLSRTISYTNNLRASALKLSRSSNVQSQISLSWKPITNLILAEKTQSKVFEKSLNTSGGRKRLSTSNTNFC